MTSPARTATHDAPPAPSTPRRPVPERPPSRVRRRALARVRRRRGVAALALVILLALAGVATGVGPAIVEEVGRRLVPSSPQSTLVDEPTSLLLGWPVADAGGEASDAPGAALVLFGVGPRVSRAPAMLMPGRTQVEVPSLGSQSLGAAMSAGSEVVSLAVENALGLDVGTAVTLDRDDLRSLVEPLAPLAVRLRSSVVLGDETFRAGSRRLSAEQTVVLLTERGEEATDLDHLVVVHAVLEGWLAGLEGDVVPLASDRLASVAGLHGDDARALGDVVEALAGSDVVFDTLDVTSLGLPGEELYEVDEDAAGAELAAAFPGLRFGEGERVTVEIRNGIGTGGLAMEVAERVIPAGAKVLLTGNAARFGAEETLVIVEDRRDAGAAEAIVDALGVGQVRLADEPIGVARVVVLIGADYEGVRRR